MGLNQFVIFRLGREEYGIQIGYAQEIIRVPQKITSVPDMPSFFEGMINLRGKVIPVINLNRKLGCENTGRDNDSRLLILDLDNLLMGIVVDDVSEVLMLSEDSIEKMQFLESGRNQNILESIARVDERLILLLNAIKMKNDIFKN